MPGYLGYLGVEEPTGLRLERMLQKARTVLALPEEADAEQIKAAFVVMVKKFHPDTAQEGVDNLDVDPLKSHYTLEAMRNAKDFLLRQLKNGQ